MPESWTDQELAEMLRKDNFEGPLWDRFAQELARYGIAVMRGWILNGKIYAELREKHIRHGASGKADGPLTAEDATDIAVEAVGLAIRRFRDKMLANGRWSADGGASLATAFVYQCLFQFPTAHRRWRKDRTPPRGPTRGYDRRGGQHAPDPALAIIGRERQIELIGGLPTDLLKAAVQLMSEGYSVRECAEHLGATQRQIESALARYRQKIHRHDEEGRTEQ